MSAATDLALSSQQNLGDYYMILHIFLAYRTDTLQINIIGTIK